MPEWFNDLKMSKKFISKIDTENTIFPSSSLKTKSRMRS